MAIDVSQYLANAAQSLEKTRDDLLAGSLQAGREQQWTLLHQLADLAAGANKLREDIETLRGNALNKPEQAAAPTFETARPRREKREGYPKFSIRGDTLVKAGLKRDRHHVYEHAVPRKEFSQILDRLGDMSRRYRDGQEFGIDEIQKGLDCPIYMTYAVTSLLLAEGLLRKVRKGAYLFVKPAQFPQESSKLWEKLRVSSSP